MTCCQIDPCPSWWSGHITGALSLLLTPPTTFSIISTIRNFTGLGAIPSTLPQKKIYKKQVLACMTTSYLPIELGVLLIGSSTLTYNDRRCMGPKVNFSPFPKHHSHWKKKSIITFFRIFQKNELRKPVWQQGLYHYPRLASYVLGSILSPKGISQLAQYS